ncbi:MAG: hypothetical protein H0T57_00165 [Rubrobacter sp.]|nr:hypothetical protein [Rubrobacter sp.]
MSRGVLAGFGVILFLASSVGLLVALALTTIGEANLFGVAEQADEALPSALVPQEAPPCDLEEVKASPDTISEEENAELIVSLSADSDTGCQDTVSLDAPNFSTNSTERTTSVSPDEKTADVRWVLAPRKTGDFKAAVTTGEGYEAIGIAVRKEFPWAQLLSGAGTVLGPMLTVPWWLDKWRERKSRGEEGKS